MQVGIGIIKLRAGAVDDPHRIDIARLEALMIWPDDPAAQSQWRAAVVKREAAALVAEGWVGNVQNVLEISSGARDLVDLQRDARGRHACGAIAGAILREAIGQCLVTGGPANLTKIMESIRAAWPIPPSPPSVKTLQQRYWSPYRSVAHLYAAAQDMTVWPCSVRELPAFLGVAREYLRLAQTGRTKLGPLIEPGSAYAVPDMASIPEVSIEIGWKQ